MPCSVLTSLISRDFGLGAAIGGGAGSALVVSKRSCAVGLEMCIAE